MAYNESLNGVRSNTSYTSNTHSGLETQRRVKTVNPTPTTPRHGGYA